ncbi:MAG: MFS transporter [Bryobacteraceae bacterium]
MIAIRFAFGVGEAGAFAGSARAIRNWSPVGERGRANGLLFFGSRLGVALSFPLLAWMLATWTWQRAFMLPALVGIAWAALWLFWFLDHPPEPLPPEPASTQPPSP